MGASFVGLGPSPLALARIPAAWLQLYQQAAATCPGLPWTVLAAIGTVESDNGRSSAPGMDFGQNPAGAEGPMQFEPATFAVYGHPTPPGGVDPPSPYDPIDAVYAAARLLCANGAAGGADLPAAVLAYNHDRAYLEKVMALARAYGQPSLASTAPGAGGLALSWALAQIGTPYLWGGEAPGRGFDCSGLVQAAYRAAGVSLPRVAQDQFDAGPLLPPGTPLQLGDLVFFGQGPQAVSHVGIYAGTRDGEPIMVDAPYTGAYVRLDPFPASLGASLGGSERFVGATRPGGL